MFQPFCFGHELGLLWLSRQLFCVITSLLLFESMVFFSPLLFLSISLSYPFRNDLLIFSHCWSNVWIRFFFFLFSFFSLFFLFFSWSPSFCLVKRDASYPESVLSGD